MEVVFRRSELYKQTYLSRVRDNAALKRKLHGFMEAKRTNPLQSFGGSDAPFVSQGPIGVQVPGLRHCHFTQDLSLVYRVQQNQVFLYGFFTHADLGTGTPGSIPRQRSAGQRFSNQNFN